MPKKSHNIPAKPSVEGAVGGLAYHFDGDGYHSLMNFQLSSQATVSTSASGVARVFTKGRDALNRVLCHGADKKVGQVISPVDIVCSNNHVFD